MRSLCLLLLALGWTAGELPPPERSYKILMVLPVSSISHRNVFLPLAKALAERGHKIEMLSNTDKPVNQTGIREISHNLPEMRISGMNLFDTRKIRDGGMSFFVELLPKIAQNLYHLPQVKELYSRRKEFDLVILDHMYNEVAYPFAHELPFMTIAMPGMDYRQSAVLGNVLNPAYVPNFFQPMSLDTVFKRLQNIFLHIFPAIYWRLWQIVPSVQKELSAQLPDLPPLLDIERNQSLTLLNSHFSMDMPVPLLPSQIEVGGLHCRPAKPLPEDIKSWLDGAGPEGAIYFSLGSIARGDTMPSKYRDMLVEAFKRLNHRILWKFERDLKGVSDNVMIKEWLPQQDILAHPNVKLFITHGGLLSLQESCYHGKPLLALPIFGDQEKNAIRAKSAGLGLWLVWEELTVDKIVELVREIIDNPRYSETVASVSRCLKDQLNHPLERAVFWTEYVVRHKGAPRLRSPGASLSWVEYLLLDVLALLFLIVVTVLLVIRWTVKKILRVVFTKSKTKNVKEKNQ
ncbi:UDP-glycosyltransferase UGT5-like [Macrobrachium rosenbergii]|uniref:UDP-glycosyltransferase UGT5-like n=1 Tax=Macrobrachium rosenbergii TaxID=79674 RepID=UPI0034D7B6BF